MGEADGQSSSRLFGQAHLEGLAQVCEQPPGCEQAQPALTLRPCCPMPTAGGASCPLPALPCPVRPHTFSPALGAGRPAALCPCQAPARQGWDGKGTWDADDTEAGSKAIPPLAAGRVAAKMGCRAFPPLHRRGQCQLGRLQALLHMRLAGQATSPDALLGSSLWRSSHRPALWGQAVGCCFWWGGRRRNNRRRRGKGRCHVGRRRKRGRGRGCTWRGRQ